MAIVAVTAIEEATATDSTSYTTSASAGQNNRLYLITVINSHASAPAAVTCTHSGGLTCVEIVNTLGANFRATLFRAFGSSGISSGTFTVDAGTATQIGWVVIVDEISGMDTSGTHGSGAIVQSNTNSGSSATATGSLSAFGDAVNNAAFMATGINSNAAITPEMTELSDIGHSSPTRAAETQWAVGENTSITATFTTSAWRVITVEIKAAAGTTAYSIDAQPGSYSLSGVAATVLAARLLDASPGAYVVTGFAVSALADRALAALPGAIEVTGAAAALIVDRFISALPAEYLVTGVAATLLAARVIEASPGSYLIVGADAALVYSGAPVSVLKTLNIMHVGE